MVYPEPCWHVGRRRTGYPFQDGITTFTDGGGTGYTAGSVRRKVGKLGSKARLEIRIGLAKEMCINRTAPIVCRVVTQNLYH